MPVIGGGYAYAHMPKTGGSWLSGYLKKVRKMKYAGRLHQPLRELSPRHWKNAIRFGTIRDPWSWYRSWWQHMSASKGGVQMLKGYLHSGVDFNWHNALYGMTHPKPGCLPVEERPIILLDKEHFLSRGYGLYSYMFYNLYGDGEDNLLVHTFLQQPRLYDAVEEFFGEPVDRGRWKPVNRAQDRPQTILDKETAWTTERVGWVRQADAEAIRLFGYAGPETPLQEAVSRLPG